MKRRVLNKIIKELDQLKGICKRIRKNQLKISCTTGVFDILHDGHLNYLLAARSAGDILIVGIDSDELVKKNKGDSRPIFPENIRSYLIAGFGCVDFVYVTNHPDDIISIVKPEIFVMSKSTGKIEHRTNQIKFIKSYGGKIIVLDPLSQMNSTTIIEKIKKSS